MDEATERLYRSALEESLRAGHAVLTGGGSSLDAVVAAVQVMEESPLFNAGRGAVYTADETHELDASIMVGRTKDAGAVAAVRHVRSPIELARLVMEESPHVMMVGDGAETFAWSHGLERVDNAYFNTERRLQQLRRARSDAGVAPPDHDVTDRYFGTVGAVALDSNGDLAAATSTGGMSNKKFGRVGDSPIIGAGTYADNATCAVSATGHGEYFIRGIIAYDVAAMMRYAGLSLSEAANAVIHGKLTDMGATGGIIAMDRHGNVSMPFNTPGMYRGTIDVDGEMSIEFFR
jgi:L-asparaginase / beta-aspartyl-peptidase